MNRPFQFHKRSRLFIGAHNETLSVAVVHQQSRSFKRAWTRNYHLSTSNYLTSAHVDGRGLNPMVNQRSPNAAATAVKAVPTVTETAAADG